MSVSLTWECHQGKLNVSARTSQRGKATGSSKGNTACVQNLETRSGKIVREVMLSGVQRQWEARRRRPQEQFFLYASYHFSFLHHSPPFQGAKFCFPDKQNYCTENQVNSCGYFKNNISDKLVIMNIVSVN